MYYPSKALPLAEGKAGWLVDEWTMDQGTGGPLWLAPALRTDRNHQFSRGIEATTSASIFARHFALNLTALHRYKTTIRENFQPPVHDKEPVKPQTVDQGRWIVAPKLVGHIEKRTGVGA
ncbi:uncharacterized protein FFUJ_00710 [Fusarium fujikuroi IMI 58289]|uniref:Uncharacterized protein n=2 Tax=Fusarium fujikuroi TaxID=5127 RepID=S0DM34_GIBF5|nr:uncharacterized protein FFUJ_00710 [Fusarium fujikuroi IMI 58289]KLO79397.1 uncharacterized protein LW93_2765 [Fusarium fujikuroi]CCT63500.1 uncharacterized protein FFUJ_00710 [Fusarium fujikuroi IMI 58289]SCN73686.1 uncharacterized protein FFM5_00734 [Fusarium fujikuroi]SCO29577.1 uncharacterized protein FFMR_01452 [Fusarium fujikuroi]SCV32464.1 uncharacterized protein FFB14_04024 [Fusarium fujikuroi]